MRRLAPTLMRSMARPVRSVACVLLVLLCVGAFTTGAAAARADQVPAPQSPPPAAYIVVDADTGAILAAENAHDARPPASTAKVMTAVTAIERLPADALVNVSDLAAAQPASRISMVAGQQWALPDALASLLMASANDAAYAIAETAGGTLDGFVVAMNDSADRMGMQDSTFADPAGLDDDTSFNGGPRMSAYDIAIATRNALAVPALAQWGVLRTYEFVDPAGRERSLTNHNRMLPGGTRAYPWATGFKTGFTERAGHTLTATATRDGRTVIAVVLGTYDTYGWAMQLFEQAFAAPAAAGAVERLPDVAVSPYDERAAAQQAFLALARPPSTTAASVATTSSTVDTGVPSSRIDGDAIANQADPDPEPGTADDGGNGGGFPLPVWVIVLVAVVLLAVVVVLRRRVVRRQRARRISLQRARAARMRSGSLTVVDGRFRPGDRTGPPVESHVRIRREDE
jgi:D-alanyl-D-alanine carboxypeptidase (penicillin-binding protein 5/6)